MNAITSAAADSKTCGIVEAICVRLHSKAPNAASMTPVIERHSLSRRADEVVVAIEAAGVNPSDVKAATGLMPYAVFPRTPGRDFSGVVVDGPPEWSGKAVFGTSGDLGIRRDGTHASHLVVEATALVEKPPGISMEEAAGIGVPFVTAIEGFRRSGMPTPGEHVLILGVNGKVGQAAAQLATWKGASVIGVVRKDEPYEGHANATVEIINSATTDVAKRVGELTDGIRGDSAHALELHPRRAGGASAARRRLRLGAAGGARVADRSVSTQNWHLALGRTADEVERHPCLCRRHHGPRCTVLRRR